MAIRSHQEQSEEGKEEVKLLPQKLSQGVVTPSLSEDGGEGKKKEGKLF